MSFVPDASFVLAWLLDEEQGGAADAVMRGIAHHRPQAPALLGYEVGNALLIALRRGRISADQHAALRAAFNALPIAYESQHGDALDRATDLARTHGLTVYDACYLELAIRRGFALACFDARLRAAGAAAKVDVLPRSGG